MEARRKRHPVAKVKGGWTPDEDQILTRLVQEHGEGNWSPIARALNLATGKSENNGRIGKQCRERWNHHLRPDIKKDAWDENEERQLVEAHKQVGNRWSDIAKVIPGRSENAVKNHWNATLRRRDLPEHAPSELKRYMQSLNLIPPRARSGCNGGSGSRSKKRAASESPTISSDEDEEDPSWQPRCDMSPRPQRSAVKRAASLATVTQSIVPPKPAAVGVRPLPAMRQKDQPQHHGTGPRKPDVRRYIQADSEGETEVAEHDVRSGCSSGSCDGSHKQADDEVTGSEASQAMVLQQEHQHQQPDCSSGQAVGASLDRSASRSWAGGRDTAYCKLPIPAQRTQSMTQVKQQSSPNAAMAAYFHHAPPNPEMPHEDMFVPHMPHMQSCQSLSPQVVPSQHQPASNVGVTGMPSHHGLAAGRQLAASNAMHSMEEEMLWDQDDLEFLSMVAASNQPGAGALPADHFAAKPFQHTWPLPQQHGKQQHCMDRHSADMALPSPTSSPLLQAPGAGFDPLKLPTTLSLSPQFMPACTQRTFSGNVTAQSFSRCASNQSLQTTCTVGGTLDSPVLLPSAKPLQQQRIHRCSSGGSFVSGDHTVHYRDGTHGTHVAHDLSRSAGTAATAADMNGIVTLASVDEVPTLEQLERDLSTDLNVALGLQTPTISTDMASLEAYGACGSSSGMPSPQMGMDNLPLPSKALDGCNTLLHGISRAPTPTGPAYAGPCGLPQSGAYGRNHLMHPKPHTFRSTAAAAAPDDDLYFASSSQGAHVLVSTQPLPSLDTIMCQFNAAGGKPTPSVGNHATLNAGTWGAAASSGAPPAAGGASAARGAGAAQAAAGGSGFAGAEPGGYKELKFGSMGPVRICLQELQRKLQAYGLTPSSQMSLHGDRGPRDMTQQAVQDMNRLLHQLCAVARHMFSLGSVVIAVRLSLDTAPNEYSVLLSVSASAMEGASTAVQWFGQQMKPLLC